MLKRHLLNKDDEAVCGVCAQLWTYSYHQVTCYRCQGTAYWRACAEEASYPRDEAYERAAARYDGEGKDWR